MQNKGFAKKLFLPFLFSKSHSFFSDDTSNRIAFALKSFDGVPTNDTNTLNLDIEDLIFIWVIHSSMDSITHVIFDLDGVLIDTERHYTTANERTMETFGANFTRDMKLKMMGRKKSEAVTVLLEDAGIADNVTVEKYLDEYEKHITELMSTLTEELPGATKLINHFHEHQIPIAICTGSDNEEFKSKMGKFEHWLEKIPIRVLCGSDPEVRNGKPHPDAYEVTIDRFVSKPRSPKNVLVFEDSINGVESALGAGCTVVMVPQREFLPHDWPEEELRSRANFSDLLSSLDEFCPKRFGLPDFREDIAKRG